MQQQWDELIEELAWDNTITGRHDCWEEGDHYKRDIRELEALVNLVAPHALEAFRSQLSAMQSAFKKDDETAWQIDLADQEQDHANANRWEEEERQRKAKVNRLAGEILASEPGSWVAAKVRNESDRWQLFVRQKPDPWERYFNRDEYGSAIDLAGVKPGIDGCTKCDGNGRVILAGGDEMACRRCQHKAWPYRLPAEWAARHGLFGDVPALLQVGPESDIEEFALAFADCESLEALETLVAAQGGTLIMLENPE